MEFLVWTERYSTGNVLVDAYHHIFFQMVSEFAHQMAEHEPVAVAERLGFLVDYTFMHFESEERLMEKAGYPDLEAHQREHQAFREKVTGLHQRFQQDAEAVPALEVLHLMQHWFSGHILHSDLAFKPYLGQA